MRSEAATLLRGAHAFGFDKCLYLIELLDGETDQPLQAIGSGLSPEYMSNFLKRVPHDPLRRMVARGEIPVGNIPISYENTGHSLSITGDRRFSATDTSLLRWCLSQGIRTGIGFRIRMSRERYASINFYSAAQYSPSDLDAAVQATFWVGHRLHNDIEPAIVDAKAKPLSRRENECLELIASGLHNREIALRLGLALDTVKEHIHYLYAKLSVGSRAEAVTRGHILGYLG